MQTKKKREKANKNNKGCGLLILVFTFPALLELQSRKLCVKICGKENNPERTPYTLWFCEEPWLYAGIIISIILEIIVFVNAIKTAAA